MVLDSSQYALCETLLAQYTCLPCLSTDDVRELATTVVQHCIEVEESAALHIADVICNVLLHSIFRRTENKSVIRII